MSFWQLSRARTVILVLACLLTVGSTLLALFTSNVLGLGAAIALGLLSVAAYHGHRAAIIGITCTAGFMSFTWAVGYLRTGLFGDLVVAVLCGIVVRQGFLAQREVQVPVAPETPTEHAVSAVSSTASDPE